MDRNRRSRWCFLLLMTDAMSMNRGVPGLRLPPAPPAEAHDPGLLARQVAHARYTWPRPRIPCSKCDDDLVLCWGPQRSLYTRHLRNSSSTANCTGGGEGALHLWAKDDLARYLSQENELRFFSRCQKCKANVRLGSVPVRPNERTVKTEHLLSTGGIADIAVCAGNETVVIEVLSTHRTAPIDGESPLGRPEPWYEVEANAVLTMLKGNSSYGELECVRLDRGCPKCESREKRRKTLGQFTLFDGKREEKTFEEASSDTGYRNKILRKLVEGQFRKVAEQLDPFSPLFPGTIAFEVPKGQYMNVSRVFRNGKLRGSSLLAFAEYLVTDPDLYAISATHHSSSAKWEKTPYKPGQVRASGVTVVSFDSRSGNWTNVATYPRAARDDDDDDDDVVDDIKPAAPSTPNSGAVGFNRQQEAEAAWRRASEAAWRKGEEAKTEQAAADAAPVELPLCPINPQKKCGKMKLLTSRSEKNPNRDYYKCFVCSCFKWVDEFPGNTGRGVA